MTSYSEVIPVEHSDRNSPQVVEKDKRFLIRQQLYYLFHAFRCTRLAYTTGRGDCQNQHCIMMRNVVKHINKCQSGKECTFQHCPSSKEIIKHWKNCNDVECQVCAPLRRTNGVRKQDNVTNKEGNGIMMFYEPLPRPKESSDVNWRTPLFRIRPNFIIKLTDELLPVKVCEDVKNHPGYSEVNNYVKGFEIEIFQSAQNLNDYFYKLAEKFEFVYRSLLSRYLLKENNNSAVHPAISRLENTNKPIESFFQLIKLQFEKFYPGFISNSEESKIKKEETSIKEEDTIKPVKEHFAKCETSEDLSTTICSETYSSIKQEPSVPSSNSAILTPSKLTTSAPPTNDSKMSPDSTSIPKKDVAPGIQSWTKDELIQMFIPIHQELFDDKDSEPFKYPVNWEVLEIPDYPTIVKHPMDLSTIKDKLINGAFKDPWEVVDDFWLMFNNAWLYNKKTSKVSKMCNTLAKIFESKVDDVMISCGFCCGRDYVYLPQVLICCTPNVCLIVRDAVYYAFQNDKSNGEKIIADLTCDRYLCCEKCYNESIEEVHFINPENNSAPCKVKKILLAKCRNNVKENEEFVFCRVCSRKWHKVCANYLEEIAKEAFACPKCVRDQNIIIRQNVFKSKSLPHNHLSRYLETRVNSFLKDKDPTINEIVIRVLSSSDKVVEVKPGMKSHYCETCEMPETFKYRLKAIFAFQEMDGHEVCFFGLHVQEYGSDCPDPNSRRVYVAYLDSVHYFNPRKYRTDMYHEFLVGYLEYVKNLGFTMAHIWACPPGEGDDYIFHMHPPEQRLPKPKRLQEWYIKMLDKAMKENIVIDYKDIFSDALHSNMLSPTELPYFDGDYWPNALEEIFKEIDDEFNKKRCHTDQPNFLEVENPKREIISKNKLSKMDKKPKKRKLKKPNFINYKRKRSGGSDTIHDVSRRVLELMEKRKENFFVIRLHTQTDAANLPEISDPDPLVGSDLMDGRDKFLCLAREKHLEFSSVRRAKFSTLVFCYELHQEQKNSILYTCNVCSKQIEIRYTCRQCEDFELCIDCYGMESHMHPLVKINPDEDPSSNNNSNTNSVSNGNDATSSTLHQTSSSLSCQPPNSELQDTFRARMVRYSQSLQHACQCRDVNCRINFCAKMKGMIKHFSCCAGGASNTPGSRSVTKNSCNVCQSFQRICFVHAKFCNDSKCPVPNCVAYRFNWKQQGSQQRMQQAQLLRRRVALMQRGVNGGDQSTNSQSVSSIDVSQPSLLEVAEVPSVVSCSSVVSQQRVPANMHPQIVMTAELPSNAPSYTGNHNSNNIIATDFTVTEDDLRLVFQQYNNFHRNYPIKEEFQKHFGDWLCSNARYKIAFDVLLKRSKRPMEIVQPGYSVLPPRDPYGPKPAVLYPGAYAQSQWQPDPVYQQYHGSGIYHHGNEMTTANSMAYEYSNHSNKRPLYHHPVPQEQPKMPAYHHQSSAPSSYLPAYIGGAFPTNAPPTAPGNGPNTAFLPRFRCLPVMHQHPSQQFPQQQQQQQQQHQQYYEQAVGTVVNNNPHSNYGQIMLTQGGGNNGMMSHHHHANGPQQQQQQQQQQPIAINTMPIPSNQ